MKRKAYDHVARHYASSKISREELEQCMSAIGDGNSYLKFNRDPVGFPFSCAWKI